MILGRAKSLPPQEGGVICRGFAPSGKGLAEDEWKEPGMRTPGPFDFWWALGDLNPRPLPCEGSALPLS